MLQLQDISADTVSTNTLISDDDNIELGEFVAASEPTVESQIQEIMLREEVNNLLHDGPLIVREREIIEKRFGLNGTRPLTLEKIGAIYNVTRERVRQIEGKALKKLRNPKYTKD